VSAGWLAQLAPAHAPPPPGWWPPAPGWWAAAGLTMVCGLALAAAVRWWREPRHRYRRAALRELKRIRASEAQGAAAAWAIESLLRRYAVAVYGRERVAALTGRAWLEFARVAGAPKLSGEAGRSLLAAAFGAPTHADREGWLAAAAEFIRSAPAASRLAR
jgi:Domain of unknown function (DUF4381)